MHTQPSLISETRSETSADDTGPWREKIVLLMLKLVPLFRITPIDPSVFLFTCTTSPLDSSHGNTCDDFLSEEQIEYELRDAGNHGSRHDQGVLCSVCSLEVGDSDRNRILVRIVHYYQRPQEVIPAVYEGKDRNRCKSRFPQRN